MYLKYYGLTIKPFDLSLKPGFLWLGEKHSEALATLNYGIQEDLGFLLLTGDVGAGKTVMIRRLVDGLDKDSTIVAHITDPGLATDEFFKMLTAEFKMPGGFQNKAVFLLQFEKFLHKAHADHKKVLLIIDEAQRLNDALLDQIRVLSNIELGDRKLINIFFIGQPEFKNMLLTDTNRPLRQRIAVNYHIDPLTEPEVAQYIAHRLRKAGQNQNLFNPDAVHEIFNYTDGYPRAINIICDHALLTGFSSGLKSIDSNVIKECKQELKIKAELQKKEEDKQKGHSEPSIPESTPRVPTRKKSRSSSLGGYSLIIGICILLSALLVYLLIRPGSSETTQAEQKIESTERSNQPTKSLENGQWRLDEKMEMEKSYASSKLPSESSSPNLSAMETKEAVVKEETEPLKELLPLPSSPKLDMQEEKNKQVPVAEKKNDEASEKKKTAANKKTETSPDQSTPASDKSLKTDEKNNSVTMPDKSLQAMAVMSAAMAAKPKTETKISPPKKTTKKSAPKKTKSAVSKEKPVATSTKTASTAKKQPKKKTEVKRNVTPLEKAEPNTALAAVVTASTPKKSVASPVSKQPSQLSGKTTATATPKTGVNEIVQTAGAASAVSTPSPSKSSPQKEDEIGLENRLRWFLKSYCVTYTKKDIDAFTKFFVPGATENGKPFESLIPKYKRNFDNIETIQYRIDMKDFSADANNGSILVKGNFSLQWLPGDRKWRENSGTISMTLIDNGPSFLVQRLEYKGSRSTK